MVNVPIKKTFFSFLEDGKILKGRKGNRPTNACPPYYLSFFFLFFFLIFFLFPCFLTFFLLYFSFMFFPCFFDPCSGHNGGLLIAPAMTRFYYFAL